MQTEQKVWSNWSFRQQNYANYPTFTEYFVIIWLFSAHVLLWGPLFVGAPVRPNMLNMPKSASDADTQRNESQLFDESAARAASRQTCCKQRWTLIVISLLPN